MFNSYKIKKLEEELSRKNMRINRLELQISLLEDKFDEVERLQNSTPSDCTPGIWCSACRFSKAIHRYEPHCRRYTTIHVCQKNESCEHFIQKEVGQKDAT